MFHDLNLTLPEVLGILLASGGLVSIWVSMSIRITRIETTVKIKIASVELSIANYIASNTKNITESFADNKEEHKEIMSEVKEMRGSLHDISITIAKIPNK
jgi:hypothetical protein